jgi:PIN domain nuclease of toxin-antitoxin system
VPSLLLDTHILVWWRAEPARLSRRQKHALLECERRREPVALSVITWSKVAVL